MKGFISLLFILFMAIVASFILTIGYSRILLALQRSKGTTDSLITSYKAESEINDLLARLIKNYLSENSFPFSETTTLPDGTRVEVSGQSAGDEQTLVVTARRSFAVSEIKAIRLLALKSVTNNVDIILVLDCTSSMRLSSGRTVPEVTTKIYELKLATLNFLDSLANHEHSDLFRVGVVVFGMDAKWLKNYSGQDVTPDSGLTLAQVRNAVDLGFGRGWDSSAACKTIMDGTSIGSGFVLAQDFFKAHKYLSTKQVEILITDGEPNSREPYAACPPNVFCPVSNRCGSRNPYGWDCPLDYGRNCEQYAISFLECSLADMNTLWDGIHRGARDPEVNAYAVTILGGRPSDEVLRIFNSYPKKYFDAQYAYKLSGILKEVFEDIISSFSTISITRVIPVAED